MLVFCAIYTGYMFVDHQDTSLPLPIHTIVPSVSVLSVATTRWLPLFFYADSPLLPALCRTYWLSHLPNPDNTISTYCCHLWPRIWAIMGCSYTVLCHSWSWFHHHSPLCLPLIATWQTSKFSGNSSYWHNPSVACRWIPVHRPSFEGLTLILCGKMKVWVSDLLHAMSPMLAFWHSKVWHPCLQLIIHRSLTNCSSFHLIDLGPFLIRWLGGVMQNYLLLMARSTFSR